MKKAPASVNGVRWTLLRAASEFAVSRETLRKKLSRVGKKSGSDGQYSTLDIVQSIYDDEWRERQREIKERADKLALDNAEKRRDLIPAEEVYKHFEGIFIALRARILASDLSNEDKDEILIDLARLVDPDFAPTGETADATAAA